ncbi:hypothetical protein H4582DRAFT_2060923 [Lactarius indigo]|nr:hypothetical protein H4582DRAFT_2060923 [Lactarius indigo]
MDEAIADEATKHLARELILHKDSPRRASPKRGAEHGDLQLPAVGPSSQAHDHIVLPLEIPSCARHRYSLKSRGREYAVVVVASRADNELDSPLLHFGDGLIGYIKLGIDSLSDMLSMDVVAYMWTSVCSSPFVSLVLGTGCILGSHVWTPRLREGFHICLTYTLDEIRAQSGCNRYGVPLNWDKRSITKSTSCVERGSHSMRHPQRVVRVDVQIDTGETDLYEEASTSAPTRRWSEEKQGDRLLLLFFYILSVVCQHLEPFVVSIPVLSDLPIKRGVKLVIARENFTTEA